MGRGALVLSICALAACSASQGHPSQDAPTESSPGDLATSDRALGDGPDAPLDAGADADAADAPQNLDANGDAPSGSDAADSAGDVQTGDGGSSDAADASCPVTLPPVPDGGVVPPLPGTNPAAPSSKCATCVTTCAGGTCDGFTAAEDRASCRNLEACVQRACSAIDGVHCYCDSAAEQTCIAGPVGICWPEIEAAAGTSDPATILPLLKTPNATTPLGLVLTRATCASASTKCFGITNECNPFQPYGPFSCAGGSPSMPCDPNSAGCDLYCRRIPIPEEPVPPQNCAQPLAELGWTVERGPEVRGAKYSTQLFSVAPNDTWLWYFDGISARYQHWDGQTWTEQVPPWKAVTMPTAIWASGSNDIWFSAGVGDFQTGSLKRWSGTKTTTMLGFAIKSIWGLGPNDVWVVDERNRVLHWDGSAWRDRSPGPGEATVLQIRGAVTDDLWGFDGVGPGISHWDGARWSLPVGTDAALRATVVQAVWASGKNDVWLLGKRCGGSQLWRWDGSRWSLSRELTTNRSAGLWGTAGNDVWLWTLSELKTFQGVALWPDPNNPDGTAGRVEHFDGTNWSVVNIGAYVLDTFSPEAPGVIWGAGEISGKEIYPATRLFHLHAKCGDATSDGGVVSPPYSWSSEATSSKWLWSFGPNDVWRSGDDGVVFRWNGSQWTQFLPKNAGDPPAAGKMWGTSASDVWFANGVNLRHWNGTNVEDLTPPSTTHKPVDVFGFGPFDVWAVKRKLSNLTLDTTAHWDGATWTDYPLTSETDPFAPQMVTAMWGADPNDLWALSHYAIGTSSGATRDGARFFHWNGSSWTEIADYKDQTAGPWGGGWLSTGQFNAWNGPWKGAWGTSASDIWAAGVGDRTDSHVVWHFDGKAWAQVKKPTDGDGGAMWGSGPDDVWSASPHGVYSYQAGRVYHSSGGAFERVDAGFHWGYRDGVSPAANEVWMIAEYYNAALPRTLLHGHKNGP